MRVLQIASNAFPIWVLAGGVLALLHPEFFTWFRGPFIVVGLAVVMLGMGLTLTVEDFRRIFTMPRTIAIGFVAQFSIMPFLGWSIARALDLEPSLAVGLVLVACCPGGTASNVVTYIARANVALSVLLTMCSTFAAVVMTPMLTRWLAGAWVPVDAWGLLSSTAQVVLLPLILGVGLNRAAPRLVSAVLPFAPLVSVLTVALICASIIGQNAGPIRSTGPRLLLAVFLLHAGGFALGYAFGRVFGYSEDIARTISIEVGMQNSGLGVVLAQKHFPGTLASVPCAISSVTHSVLGSILAGIWRLRSKAQETNGPAASPSAGNPPEN